MATSDSHSSGVLPSQDISRLIDKGIIYSSSDEDIKLSDRIQPASMDLTLGSKAYRLQSSFLPQNSPVRDRMKDLLMYEINLDDGGIFERGAVYLVPLNERLNLNPSLRGKTNPKSSTGRLDVFTRVITDNCYWFDYISSNYKGELFLEVVPLSFTIKVRSGQTLNQIRLQRLESEESQKQHKFLDLEQKRKQIFITEEKLAALLRNYKLLYDQDNHVVKHQEDHITDDGILMSVDLNKRNKIVGYKAKRNSSVIDLDKMNQYSEDDFWEPIHPPKNGRLILEPEEFYILASKEKIRVPLNCAAEMVEFDAGSGELRTHYAGFFDPGFGYGRGGEVKGTKAVLEVRPHDVPFIIEDGQILFKMKYETMSAKPDIWYGSEIGSNYHDQSLRLAKQFKQGSKA